MKRQDMPNLFRKISVYKTDGNINEKSYYQLSYPPSVLDIITNQLKI